MICFGKELPCHFRMWQFQVPSGEITIIANFYAKQKHLSFLFSPPLCGGVTYGRLLRSKKALFDHSPSLLFSPSPAWIRERKSPNMSLFWAFCKCWQKLVKKSLCGPKYYPHVFLFFIFGESRAVPPSPSNSKLAKVALPVALHAAERRDGEAG